MFLTCTKIKDLMTQTFGDSIKEYFIENPSLVPFSQLPCLSVAPIATDIDIIDTARDSWTYTIDVILIIDAKKELGKYKQEIVGTRYLTETMEGKTSAGVLRENTVLYVLRNNLRLEDNWYVNNIERIDYSIRQRTDENGKQCIVKEATLRLSVVRLQNRP